MTYSSRLTTGRYRWDINDAKIKTIGRSIDPQDGNEREWVVPTARGAKDGREGGRERQVWRRCKMGSTLSRTLFSYSSQLCVAILKEN